VKIARLLIGVVRDARFESARGRWRQRRRKIGRHMGVDDEHAPACDIELTGVKRRKSHADGIAT
jgi:hypothetical protein